MTSRGTQSAVPTAGQRQVSSVRRRTRRHADRRCAVREAAVACIAIDDRFVLTPDNHRPVGHREVRRIGKGAVVGLFGGILSVILTTAYQVIVARRLGAAGFGVLALALAIASFLAEGCDLGLDYGTLRFGAIVRGAGEPGRFRAILRPSLIGSLAIGGAAGILLALGSGIASDLFHRPYLAPALVPLALTVPFTASTEIMRAAQRALGNAVRPVASSSLIGPGLRMLTAAVILTMIPSAAAAAWAYFLTEAATTVITWLMLWRLLPPADGSRFPLGTLYRFSLPMSLNRVLLYSNNQTEVFFLGFLAPTATIGIFSIARRLSVLVGSALMTSITILFNPLVADMHHTDRTKELDTVFKTATRWMTTLALPVSLVFVLFPADVMKAVGGADFQVGATALIILAVGQLVNVGTGTTSNLQAMAGFAKLTLFNSLLFLSMSIVFDLLLIPRFGLMGAAIANSSSLILVNVVRLWQIWRNLGLIPYDRSFLQPLAAAIPASFVAKVLVPELHIGGAVGLLVRVGALGLVYAGALIALGLEPIDRQLARAAIGRFRGRRTEVVVVQGDRSAGRAA